MELKRYQKQIIADLSRYLDCLKAKRENFFLKLTAIPTKNDNIFGRVLKCVLKVEFELEMSLLHGVPGYGRAD